MPTTGIGWKVNVSGALRSLGGEFKRKETRNSFFCFLGFSWVLAFWDHREQPGQLETAQAPRAWGPTAEKEWRHELNRSQGSYMLSSGIAAWLVMRVCPSLSFCGDPPGQSCCGWILGSPKRMVSYCWKGRGNSGCNLTSLVW